MAENESIGGVSVQITGDASGLGPAFTAAQSQAQSAGTAIANSFNTGAAGADQITAAIERLTAALREESAASTLAIQRNAALGGGLRQFGQSAEGAHLNLRFLILGLKDLAEGRTTFAMAEMVNVLRGFGPVVLAGAASLGVLAAAFYGPIAAAKELAAEIDKTNKEIDDGLEKSLRAIENLNVKSQEMQFGAAAGKRLEGIYSQQAYQSDLDKVQRLTGELQEMSRQAAQFKLTDVVPYLGSKDRATEQKSIVDKQAEIEKILEGTDVKRRQIQVDAQDTARLAAQQAGALAVAQVALQEAQLTHQSNLNKAYSDEEITQARDAANKRIAATVGEYDRVVAMGAAEVEEAKARQRAITNALASEIPERIRLARAAGTAEQAGKSGPEQQRIGLQTEAKVVGIQTGADKQTTDAQANVVAAQQKATVSLIELNEGLTATLRAGSLSAYEDILKTTREVTSEQQKQTATMTEELLREQEGRAAIAQASGKAQGEVAAAQLKANYQLQGVHTLQQEISYRQQLAAIQQQEYASELSALQAKLAAAEALADETDKSRQVLEIQKQIVALKGQSQAANITAQGQVQGLQNQQDPLYEIGQNLKGAIQELPQTLGNTLSKGIFDHSKGQSIGKDVGQTFKGAGQQLTGKILSDALRPLTDQLQKVLDKIIPDPTKAVQAAAAKQNAVAAQQTATASQRTATAIQQTNTALQQANNELTQILAAIRQEAACACKSESGGILSKITGALGPIGAIASLFGGLFGGGGGGGPEGTSSSTISFGDAEASGTDSAPGGMTLVGEKGPEIVNLPRGSQVIPNHAIKSYADGTPGYTRSYGGASHSTSIGELHVHAHGVNNPDAFARQAVAAIPGELKRQSSSFSPYSR